MVFSVSSIPVNLIQITFTWHMLTLWQRWVITEGFDPGLMFDRYFKMLDFFSRPSFAQSCHIGEEEEGGDEMVENAEDEMSFEVRQSELVMGGQGLGTRNTVER